MKDGRKFSKRAERSSISLAAFAGAHQQKYSKLAKIDKRRKLNAKKVNQYRKLKRKLGLDETNVTAKIAEEAVAADSLNDDTEPQPQRKKRRESQDGGHEVTVRRKDTVSGAAAVSPATAVHTKPKKYNALEVLAKKEQEARKQKEAERARLAAEKAEREAARQRAAAERKRHAALMRKTNSKGQPVMKYRMEGILEKLLQEQRQQGK